MTIGTKLLLSLAIMSMTNTHAQSENYEKRYYRPSHTARKEAMHQTDMWLSAHADRIGIPMLLDLSKLSFNVNEMTFIELEELLEKDSTASQQEIDRALLAAESDEMYERAGRFEHVLHGRPQQIFFQFDAHGQLLGVSIYEDNGIDYLWYDTAGKEHDPYAH
jgi:hypothetical protein